MATRKLKVGLLGSGRIGRVHAANLAAHPGVDFAWVADPMLDSALEVAALYGASATAEASMVLADPDLDALLICSPTPTHVGLIIEAANRGIAVLCEKPVDLDLDRARACREATAGSTAPIMMAFNRRFDPSFREVREAVEAGEIGALENLAIISRDPAPAPLGYLEVSGGIFKDQSIHDLDMARSFLPDIVEVTAHGSNLFDEGITVLGDYDSVQMTLRAASGALVSITNSRHCSSGYDQRLEAFGPKGMLEVANATDTLVRRSSAAGTSTAGAFQPFFLERYARAYAAELDYFVSCILEGRTPVPGLEDGIAALELAQAALVSARERRTVSLAEIRDGVAVAS
ncbi:inositol 2-dehydrogenase [Paeniglutamicibacter cryotolerans]|uniref:Myo-inositol 2-dehydrogenase/D-chiro-inositol 1-dehydrogenase n=1 Tax=Paeniglutamicibacter cryotolerans TaxID=670079 RepID=A0A839QGZ5_9MICC|nr:inositol 2-dehydrogenase [Paeniglutamicibacter cryotolerans]MBB2995449.1 myo-inositol 2-dehydrogenase/D-chiro-inositol 1-dehydrogenase [Paeniglutamicibacter cryotolerans]